MNHIYINPELVAKVEAKTDELMDRWNLDRNERHTIFQMVATIETGMAQKVFYDGDGITCDGWNGYRNTENACRNPYRAFGGFYRLDKNQMVGWSVWLLANTDSDKEAQANRCTNAYGHWIIWEDQVMVDGFMGYQSFYTEREAQEAERIEAGRRGYKRSSIQYSDMSGCYMLKVENSVAKPKLKNVYKGRIAK